MNKEVWKDIQGYEGLYQVSNMGRVKGLSRIISVINGRYKFKKIEEKILKNSYTRKGYLSLDLNKDGVRKQMRVHRLVAAAFIPNKDANREQVNHINGKKDDNTVTNLEWCTCSENVSHSYNNLNRSKFNKPKKPVAKFDLNGNLIEIFEGTKEAIDDSGTYQGKLRDIMLGKLDSYNGFRWKYLQDIQNNKSHVSTN